LKSVGEECEEVRAKTEAAAYRFRRLTAELGADGFEVDKPTFKNRTGDFLQCFAYSIVQFDFIVECAQRVPVGALFFEWRQVKKNLLCGAHIKVMLNGTRSSPLWFA
jgi:hypothetical protein